MPDNNFHKSQNATSKTFVSNTEIMVLDSLTKKNIEIVRENVKDMLKRVDGNWIKLIEYVMKKGTPVYIIKDIDKKLGKLGLEEGFIFELDGFNALKLNLTVGAGFSFHSVPMFVLEDKPLEPFFILHQFYKWFSYYKKLPGFDMTSQKLFRLSMLGKLDMKKLTLSELAGLKEAINRDKEATDFTIQIVKETEGARNAMQKMQDGGANV